MRKTTEGNSRRPRVGGTGRKAFILATACVLTASVAACGSTPEATSDGSANDPIMVGALLPLSGPLYTAPDAEMGLQAAVAQINSAGGISGRDIELTVCDTQLTANLELACARQMVDDNVVAVVAPFLVADQSGAEYKLWETAGIPTIGGSGFGTYEMSDPNSFPLGAGIPGLAYGIAAQMVETGATNISIVGDEVPGTKTAVEMVEAALDASGVQHRTVVADPASDPTFATAAAKAIEGGVDGIINFALPQSIPKITAAIRGAGYTGVIGSNAFNLPAPVLEALGADAEGFLVSSNTAFATDTSNPGVASYIKDVSAYSNQPQVTNTGLAFWSAAKLLGAVLESAKTVDAAGVKEAASSVSTPIDIGTIGPWRSLGVSSPLPQYPRILNPTVNFGVIKGGEIVSAHDGFIDPFAMLAAAKPTTGG